MLGVTIGVGHWRKAAKVAAEMCRKHIGLTDLILGDDDWRPTIAIAGELVC